MVQLMKSSEMVMCSSMFLLDWELCFKSSTAKQRHLISRISLIVAPISEEMFSGVLVLLQTNRYSTWMLLTLSVKKRYDDLLGERTLLQSNHHFFHIKESLNRQIVFVFNEKVPCKVNVHCQIVDCHCQPLSNGNENNGWRALLQWTVLLDVYTNLCSIIGKIDLCNDLKLLLFVVDGFVIYIDIIE